jgi:mobilome CxxCx(11)CxxC protein
MIDQGTVEKIEQKKLNSLAAKHFHAKWLGKLDRLNWLTNFLGIAVPIMGFPFRLLAQGKQYSTVVDVGWTFLASALLVITVWKIAYGWQNRTQKHHELLAENISLVSQADNLITKRNTSSHEAAELFFLLADRSEVSDMAMAGTISENDRHSYYRAALKEFGNAEVVCPKCKSSPWNFIPGSCQMCGNTPERSRQK